MCDAPPNSSTNSTTDPNVKIEEGEIVGIHSLTRNISGVERCVGALEYGLGRVTSG